MAEIGSEKLDSELILALATGCSVNVAAERAGVSARTVYRRLEEESFQKQVAAARSELFTQALGKLAGATESAIDTLADLLGSKSPTARLGAARAILEHGQRLRDQVDFETRLAKLEEASNAK